jgi:hypothetical protein
MSSICYLKLRSLHIFCIIKYTYAGWSDFLSFSGIEALMIYSIGTFSFLVSLVSVLNNYVVHRKHVRPYSVISCWILSITNYLSSQCLHLLRQRLNYLLHDLLMFPFIPWCYDDAVRYGMWGYQPRDVCDKNIAWSTHIFNLMCYELLSFCWPWCMWQKYCTGCNNYLKIL